jgi:hypothetical protein
LNHVGVGLYHGAQMSRPDRVRASLLLRDLDLALAVLDIAAKTRFPEKRASRIAHARETYQEVTKLTVLAELTTAERIGIATKLSAVRSRLEEFGRTNSASS